MTYNRDIPAANDLISVSQGQIQGNFQTIDSGTTGTGVGFSRNHVTMTDATNGGLHERVDFYENVSAPSITGFVSSLYPRSTGGASQLFFKNGVAEYQVSGPITAASTGVAPIFGGFKFAWGIQSVSNGATITVSGMTTLYQPQISIDDSSSTPTVRAYTFNVTGNTFQIRSSSGSPITIRWMAIGI